MFVYFKKNSTHFLNVLFLTALNFAVSTTASAELVKIAAMVDTVNGLPISVFYVLRGDKKLDIFPTQVLQDGDYLWITQPQNKFLKDKQNYVTLTFGDNHSETVTYDNSPYLVKKRDTVPSIPKNVFNETKTWFSTLFKHYLEKVVVTTKNENEQASLSMPLLTKHPAQMVAGERVLHLAWQGGTAPYMVQVFQGNAKKPFLKGWSDSEKRVQLAKRLLHVGHYWVVVIDAYGKTMPIPGKFQVVENLPVVWKKIEQKIMVSTMSEPAKETLFAAWLAQQEQGAWQFETYQRIAGIAKEYQPALLIRKELEKD